MLPPIVCPACQHQNAAGSTFCGQCGNPLAANSGQIPPVQSPVAPTQFNNEEITRNRDSKISQTLLVGIICFIFMSVSTPVSQYMHLTGFSAVLMMLLELTTTVIFIICHIQYCYLVGNKKGYPMLLLLGFAPCIGVILAGVWPTNPEMAGQVIVENRDLKLAAPIQQTQIAPTTSYQPSATVAPTVTKPNYTLVIVAVVVMGLICSVCGIGAYLSNRDSAGANNAPVPVAVVNGSGVMFESKELTKDELETGIKESKELFKRYPKIEESAVATSPLSTSLKYTFLSAISLRATEKYERTQFDEGKMYGKMLVSKSELEATRKLFDEVNAKTMKYFDSRASRFEDIQRVSAIVNGSEDPGFKETAEQERRERDHWKELQIARTDIMDFLEKTPFTMKGNSPTFATDADGKELTRLLKAWIAAGAATPNYK